MSVLKKRKSDVSASYEQLHSKNPFRDNEPDFKQLSMSYPSLIPFLKTVNDRVTVDWKDPDSAREVTNVLLQEKFGIKLSIPENHLCPPLPNRINYLCWISDLLGDSSSEATRILDIGVGPLCIYPILGHKLFRWQFIGSDIDPESIRLGRINLATNTGLKNSIELYNANDSNSCQKAIVELYLPYSYSSLQSVTSLERASCHGPIIEALTAASKMISSSQSVDVVMTNPPFYDTEEQIHENDRSVCKGTVSEMRTFGGEVAFICAMIVDSLQLRERITWYTAMVGKKASLRILQGVLSREMLPSTQVFTTEFKQGRTTRWGIGWTFNALVAEKYRKSVETTRRQSKLIPDVEWRIVVSARQLLATRLPAEVNNDVVEGILWDRIATSAGSQYGNFRNEVSEVDKATCHINLLSVQFVQHDHYSVQWDGREVGRLKLALVTTAEAEESLEINALAQFASNISALVETVEGSEVEDVQRQFMQWKTDFENNILRMNRRWRRKLIALV